MTSLVDVAFTLLVIFIITAPILQGGIEVSVPRADIAPLEADTDPVIVSITGDGKIFIGDTDVTEGDFPTILARVVEAQGARAVFVKGDSLVSYGRVARAIAEVQALEQVGISLIMEPWARDR